MTSRRVVLASAGAAMLAGCQTYGAEQPAAQPAAQPQTTAAEGALAKVADIPVGGGKVFANQKVVVTQPSAGVIKAFSAVCTHQGCTVADVSNGTINCPCHGSTFKIADGSVAAGPAKRALPVANVTVASGEIKLG